MGTWGVHAKPVHAFTGPPALDRQGLGREGSGSGAVYDFAAPALPIQAISNSSGEVAPDLDGTGDS